MLGQQLTAAEREGFPPQPIPPMAWALALCPLFVASALRTHARLSRADAMRAKSKRDAGVGGWQRFSESIPVSPVDARSSSNWVDCGSSDTSPSDSLVGRPPDVDGCRSTAHIVHLRSAPIVRLEYETSRSAWTSSFRAHAFGIERGRNVMPALVGLTVLALYTISGAMLCAKLGKMLNWSWVVVATPAWYAGMMPLELCDQRPPCYIQHIEPHVQLGS